MTRSLGSLRTVLASAPLADETGPGLTTNGDWIRYVVEVGPPLTALLMEPSNAD